MMRAPNLRTEVDMKALRGVFFFGAALAGCFSDGSVKVEIAKAARVCAAILTVLFVIAEAIELMT
jgi:hypothetical protein